MRDNYHESLESVVTDLVGMSEAVQVAVRDATKALLDADLASAEQVISDDAKIDQLHDDLEARCFSLLARQAPVAGELRTVVAAHADGRPTWPAWATWPPTWPRSPGCATPNTPCPRVAGAQLHADGARGRGDGRDRRPHAARSATSSTPSKLADSDDEMDELRKSQFRVMLGNDWPLRGRGGRRRRPARPLLRADRRSRGADGVAG